MSNARLRLLEEQQDEHPDRTIKVYVICMDVWHLHQIGARTETESAGTFCIGGEAGDKFDNGSIDGGVLWNDTFEIGYRSSDEY